MTRAVKLAAFLLTLVCSPAWAQDWATKMFEVTRHDFGTVARGAKAEFEFKFKNLYVEDVHVASVRSSCGCTNVRIDKPDLKTHEESAVIATVNTLSFQGSRGATLTVTFDKPFYAEVQLQAACYIRSDVVFQPGSVELGAVDQGAKVERTVVIAYAGRGDWQILGVKSNNPHVSAKVAETMRNDGQVGYNLSVQLDAKAPAGYINEHLILQTNDRQKPQVPIAVEGRVESAITVSPGALFLGTVQTGQKVTKQIVIRGKTPFRILSISSDGKGFEFDTSAEGKPKSLHLIPVTFLAGGETGKVLHKIHIQTDTGKPVSELSAYAQVTP